MSTMTENFKNSMSRMVSFCITCIKYWKEIHQRLVWLCLAKEVRANKWLSLPSLPLVVQVTHEQHGFELQGSIYKWMFLNKHLYCFQTAFASWWMQKADCMHCSMPLYIGDLSIHGFWYLQGPGTNSPRILRDDTFLGNQKLLTYFWRLGGWCI